MRRITPSVTVLLLLCALCGCQEQVPRPEVILKNAIAAHGGEAGLEKAMIGRVKGKGTGEGMSVTWEETYHFPGRFRKRTDGQEKGRPINEVFVENGNKAWWQGQDRVVETNARGGGGPFAGILTLLELSQRDWSETRALKTKLNGQVVVGFELSERKTEVYFSPKTWLLSGVRVKIQHPENGKEGVQETLTSDYRDVDGLRLPHKAEMRIQGLLMLTTTITEIQFLEKVQDGIFDRP
jgi:outer membrane lipoprotein-sorting protein